MSLLGSYQDVADLASQKAGECLRRQHLESAEALARDALLFDPENAEALATLGTALYFRAGSYRGAHGVAAKLLEESLSCLEKATANNIESFDAKYMMGSVFIAFDRPKEAEKVFRDLFAIRPEDAAVSAKLALSLLEQRQYREAKIHVRRAVDLEKEALKAGVPSAMDQLPIYGNISMGYGIWAEISRKQGRYNEACAMAEKCMQFAKFSRDPEAVALAGECVHEAEIYKAASPQKFLALH